MFKDSDRKAERLVEGFIFSSRWILAPFYVGLALSIVLLLIKFVQEFFHIAVQAFSASEAEIIVGVLSLVDLALTGSLIVIVIFSGYENFVSRIDHSGHKDWPEWIGKIDFAGLKLKLLSSIVAISAIQLLKQFMAVKSVPDRELFWYVIIHLVFVSSGVLLALSDRISEWKPSAKPAPEEKPQAGTPAASEAAPEGGVAAQRS